jgi:hypothetical protein
VQRERSIEFYRQVCEWRGSGNNRDTRSHLVSFLQKCAFSNVIIPAPGLCISDCPGFLGKLNHSRGGASNCPKFYKRGVDYGRWAALNCRIQAVCERLRRAGLRYDDILVRMREYILKIKISTSVLRMTRSESSRERKIFVWSSITTLNRGFFLKMSDLFRDICFQSFYPSAKLPLCSCERFLWRFDRMNLITGQK